VSISPVGTSSSIVSAVFRQLRSTEGGGTASRAQGAGGRRAEGEESSTDTETIQALKKQLAEAEAQLRQFHRAKAVEEAIRTAQQRVQACASALAAALAKQAEAAKKAEQAAGAGGQYI
jgi:hypothetical protein